MDLERGDRLVKKGISWGGNPHPQHTFRFRIDPVPFFWPGSGSYRFRNWYKFPKVMQEKRASFAYPELVRGKRKAHALPDPWDDWKRGDVRTRRSWKNKKIKKQWMKAGIRQR